MHGRPPVRVVPFPSRDRLPLDHDIAPRSEQGADQELTEVRRALPEITEQNRGRAVPARPEFFASASGPCLRGPAVSSSDLALRVSSSCPATCAVASVPHALSAQSPQRRAAWLLRRTERLPVALATAFHATAARVLGSPGTKERVTDEQTEPHRVGHGAAASTAGQRTGCRRDGGLLSAVTTAVRRPNVASRSSRSSSARIRSQHQGTRPYSDFDCCRSTKVPSEQGRLPRLDVAVCSQELSWRQTSLAGVPASTLAQRVSDLLAGGGDREGTQTFTPNAEQF